MQKIDIKNRTIITLIGSFLLFTFGTFRIMTESLSSTSLFVAYVFAITGFIGIIANGSKLRKIR
ncbi:hypothetical protein COE51_09855 [Bacillus pseudomycoides]|nr:hypothetical protein COE51_09855 [Bacillus pseudomycoides]